MKRVSFGDIIMNDFNPGKYGTRVIKLVRGAERYNSVPIIDNANTALFILNPGEMLTIKNWERWEHGSSLFLQDDYSTDETPGARTTVPGRNENWIDVEIK